MVKKGALIAILIIVGILSIANIFLFINNGKLSYTRLSGMVFEEEPELIFNTNTPTLLFVLQWIILGFIMILAYSKFVKRKKDTLTKEDYLVIKQKKTKSETDLDILYNLLKNKKRLHINTISKLFGVTKEKALEWGKILENHDLVRIDYPVFNESEINLLEENKNEKEQKNKK